jgi:hypothetical protein
MRDICSMFWGFSIETKRQRSQRTSGRFEFPTEKSKFAHIARLPE